MRIWLDTDIGTDVDDALALGYILRHPDLDLVGVSTVFGDLTIRNDIVHRVIELANTGIAAEPVPVVSGLTVPLTEGRHGLLFGHEGREILEDPTPILRIETEPGGEAGRAARVDDMAAAIDQAQPDRIVAIGPLTNLGALADAGVDLPPVTAMGGKFDLDKPSGLSDRRPEWNWYCDPVAVEHVLALGDRLDAVILPAEVTFQTGLDDAQLDRLAAGDPLNQTLAALCREWLRAQDEDHDFDDPRVILHDPLAAAVLVEPDLCQWVDRRITVDHRGNATEHALAPDGEPAEGTLLHTACEVDAPAVSAELLRVLGV
ncbi:MAG: nucleoside hydrolase [Actinomycetota bacterium]